MDTAPTRPSRFVHAGAKPRIRVSFEFFPPKTAEMERSLWDAIGRLAPLQPNFVSVTYGAGGSTRERTHATVKRILAETMLTPAAHLTCIAATRAEVDAVIGAYAQVGVRHIVALRGDPPGGIGQRYAPHPGGYRNAAGLEMLEQKTLVPEPSSEGKIAVSLWLGRDRRIALAGSREVA